MSHALSMPVAGSELVQQALGLSRARLYRAFAPLGGVASYIRARRLKRSKWAAPFRVGPDGDAEA